MKTKLDHITDKEIADMLTTIDTSVGYGVAEYVGGGGNHVVQIAMLARAMNYWKSWVGLPLTYYSDDGLEYDGQHRCRAVKFLIRRFGVQIQIPVRYGVEMMAL